MAHCFGVELEEVSDSDNKNVEFIISSRLDKVTVFPLNSSLATSPSTVLPLNSVNIV
jgi:hypothetical protein